MDEKWRLALWAAAAAKDMEFAATQRSAIPFVEEDKVFFDKLKPQRQKPLRFNYTLTFNFYYEDLSFSGYINCSLLSASLTYISSQFF